MKTAGGPAGGPPRALVVQYKRIGDTLLLEPLVRSLREAGWHVTLGILPACATAAKLIRPHEITLWPGGIGALGALGGLALKGFDACIDTGGTDRCMAAAIASRASVRIIAARFRKFRSRQWVFNRLVESSVMDRHTIDHFLDHLEPLGIPPANPPFLRLDSTQLPALGSNPATAPLAGARYIVCHVGAARPEKFWSAGNWIQLLRTLLAENPGMSVALTGADGKRETAQRNEIIASLPQVLDLGGKCGLDLTSAVLKHAALEITVDSMPVHLASGLGAPVAALFGPTNPKNWGPRGPQCISIQESHAHRNPESFPRGNPNHLTVDAIPVDLVIESCRELLKIRE